MLTVCAYVVFFSSLVGCLGAILSDIGADSKITATIFAFFELSGGVSAAKELDFSSAAILCAAALGWSGLSVHFQIMTIAAGRNISFKPYFLAKFASSVLCAALFFAAIKLFPFSEDVFGEIGNSVPHTAVTNGALACIIFFSAVIVPIIYNFIKKRLTTKNEDRA